MKAITLRALADSPLLLEAHYEAIPSGFKHWAPHSWEGVPSEPFTAIEQICHVRDIEVDGYHVRFQRTLYEVNPRLSSIDGEALAEERSYPTADAAEVFASIRIARARTVQLISKLSPEQLMRPAIFEESPSSLRSLVHICAAMISSTWLDCSGCLARSRPPAPGTERAMRENLSMPSSAVIPVLAYPDVRQAVECLCKCFGFTERLRIGEHRSQLVFGDGAVVVTGSTVDGSQDASTHSVTVRVANVDDHFAHATSSGIAILSPPTTHPYGERQYSASDIGGHQWTFSQTVENVDPGHWGGELLLRD